MRTLTDRQEQVLRCIAESVRVSGYPPTIREIGNALGIRSTNGVNDHLKALERKGYIERDMSKSRAIILTHNADRVVGEPDEGAARDMVAVPLVGRIAAGAPIEAIENIEDVLHVGASMLGRNAGKPVFALRVEGDSMIGDGIFDGDIVFVRREQEARRGEIVAVMVDGAATVKRFYREGRRIRLEPRNPKLKPIVINAADARETVVLGKVVGVFRTL